MLQPVLDRREADALSWELQIPDADVANGENAFIFSVVGYPGDLVGLPPLTEAQRKQTERLGALYVGVGRAVVMRVRLRQLEEGLAFELQAAVRSDRGENLSTLGVAWFCPPEVEYPLEVVRWVGPADGFVVPADGMDLLDLGQSARLRIEPVQPQSGPGEGSGH